MPHHGETLIKALAFSAAPCGHCRQFLNEVEEKGKMRILIPHAESKILSFFLPEAFGPKDLGLKANLMPLPQEYPSFEQESPLVKKALQAAFNPSLFPLQAALVADLREYEEITEVVLVEQPRSKIRHL